MRTSHLTAHDIFYVTRVAANVFDHILWNSGATKKYTYDG